MKNELRKKYLKRRDEFNQVEEYSQKIIQNIKNTFQLGQFQCVGFYMPLQNEVDLRPLIKEMLQLNKKIVLPKVLDKTTMQFFEISDLSDVRTSSFNILEPISTKPINKEDIDILFIPGIAFSVDNKRIDRLGFGAGYYDRYLIDYPNRKVGICFNFQITNEFTPLPHDVKLDCLITESHVHQYHDED